MAHTVLYWAARESTQEYKHHLPGLHGLHGLYCMGCWHGPYYVGCTV